MIGNRLKELRRKKNLSQRELAKELGVSTSLIGMYETDNRDPEMPMLINLSDYFGVTTDYLLGRVDKVNGIVLEGDKLPQKYKDRGMDAIAILKEALDENGALTPEAERELTLLLLEMKIRMAASPAYRKSIKPDDKS